MCRTLCSVLFVNLTILGLMDVSQGSQSVASGDHNLSERRLVEYCRARPAGLHLARYLPAQCVLTPLAG